MSFPLPAVRSTTLTARQVAVALSEAAGNTNLKPENCGHLVRRHRSDPALGAGPLHVVRLVFDINVKDIIVAPSTTFERNACLAGAPTPDGIASVNGTPPRQSQLGDRLLRQLAL